MLPKTLALIDDDIEFTEFLSQYLRGRGVSVAVFSDSNAFLAHLDAFSHDFYIVDLMMPGIDGLNLIRVLRRRTRAGLLVISGRLGSAVFADVVAAGADMYLAKPVQFEQVAVAIEAVHRRASSAGAEPSPWVLDRRKAHLVAPDGARVELSRVDVALLECFAGAENPVVCRDELRRRLGKAVPEEGSTDGIAAIVYRLRRRIERATPMIVPLQSRSRVGYEFKGVLRAV